MTHKGRAKRKSGGGAGRVKAVLKTNDIFDQAVALHQQSRLDEAKAKYQAVLADQPKNAHALHLLGVIASQQDDHEQAQTLIRQAIQILPGQAPFYTNLGLALHGQQRFEESAAYHAQALALAPAFAEAHANMAISLQALGHLEEALASCEKSLSLNPSSALVQTNHGAILEELGRLEEAVTSFNRVIALSSSSADAYFNRGNVLMALGQLDAAVASYDQALALSPSFANAHFNRAEALTTLGQLEAATDSYDQALALAPRSDILWNKSRALLLAGDYENGLPLLEWRWENEKNRPTQRHFAPPLWLGKESLAGKTILLHAEMGFGDTLHFCRYAPLVASRGARVILEVQRPLARLLEQMDGVAQVIAKGDPLPAFDLHCPFMSLPLAFGTTLETIPLSGKYLASDADKRLAWALRLGPKTGPRIGLVWSGSKRSKNDPRGALLSTLIPFLPMGFSYVSLKKEVDEADKEVLAASTVRHFGDELEDFRDTAALCELMDLVISVDTGVGHLSAALGKETWLMLSFAADWRWLRERTDSPWYDSVTLYRQERLGDWESVFTRVQEALLRLEVRSPDCAPDSYRSESKRAPMRAPVPEDHEKARLAELLQRAEMLRHSGQLAQARELYETILALGPQADAVHGLGFLAAQAGQFGQAVQLIGQAIALAPQRAIFYAHRGIFLKALGHPEAALAEYDQALALDPSLFVTHSYKGNALREMGRLEESVASYDQAFAADPMNALLLCNRGLALHGLGRFPDALADFDQAVQLNSSVAEIFFNRGNTLRTLGRLDEALQDYDQAIAINPGYVNAYFNRANVLKDMARYEESVASYDQSVTLRPDFADAWANRGGAFLEEKRFAEAVESFSQAISINPGHALAYSNRGAARVGLDHVEEALKDCDKAIALDPTLGEAYCNRGLALSQLRRFDEELITYEHALALEPDNAQCWFNKSLALLALGDYSSGWKAYEWRWRKKDFTSPDRNFSQPQWRGKEDLTGKRILLHAEQGLGDTIQFCRYVPLVVGLGARVFVEVPQPLVGLLHQFSGVERVLTSGQPLPSFDVHCPLMSLPLAFETTVETIPLAEKYLVCDAQKTAHWRQRLPQNGPVVGLVWNGSGKRAFDHRSMALATLLPYLPLGCQFVCLQKEINDADRSALESSSIVHFEDDLHDFTDTTALCEVMDVVVTIDTSLAHLSGALGKKTLLLVDVAADWRWLLQRTDCPWYKSVTLYRQDKRGDWSAALERVRADLERLFFPESTP